MKTVYLSGGIKGFTEEEKHAWREKAKKLLNAETIDPTRISYDGRNTDEIIETDMSDMMKSDYILVYFIRASVGTSQEMVYANFYEKIVYTVNELKQDLSPWMIYHSDKIFDTLEEAVEVINRSK